MAWRRLGFATLRAHAIGFHAMIHQIAGTPVRTGDIQWELSSTHDPVWPEAVEVTLSATSHYAFTRQRVESLMRRSITGASVPWLVPGHRYWLINLSQLRSDFSQLEDLLWLSGNVFAEPEYSFDEGTHMNMTKSFARVTFWITPDSIQHARGALLPEIRDSLERLYNDYPDTDATAFIMMSFKNNKINNQIFSSIKNTLSSIGISALRADEKEYHPDLYYNILTYIHACRFGVAVFDRIEDDYFNPNVSLEVGYMFGMGKPVCLLKDRTLRALQSDLVGRLYRPFAPTEPRRSLPTVLIKWVRDYELLPVSHGASD